MRDLTLSVIVFGLIPFIIVNPYIGVLAWSWLSYMNPHRLTWSFAHSMPFAEIVAIATIISLFFTKESRRLPINALIVIWLLFIAWMGVTTFFSLEPYNAWPAYERVLKIQFVTFLTMMVMCSKERLQALIWVIVLSIGFYSIKGGLFTILSGGQYRVWGPEKSFIEENNALALATLMIMPLMYYLYLESKQTWIKLSLLAGFALSTFSVLGSHSRGAIIAGVTVAAFFWLKSQKKLVSILILLMLIPVAVNFMPDNWSDRIATMTNDVRIDPQDMATKLQLNIPIAERDQIGFWANERSANGRINAWNYAINVANARVTGGGLESWEWRTFEIYAPITNMLHSSHSIYFGVLADHGWIGLGFFLLIWLMVWRTATVSIKLSCHDPALSWLTNLARMIQVSLVAYASGGAFLSLAYFDLPWHLAAMAVLCRVLAERAVTESNPDSTGASAPALPLPHLPRPQRPAPARPKPTMAKSAPAGTGLRNRFVR